MIYADVFHISVFARAEIVLAARAKKQNKPHEVCFDYKTPASV